MQSFTRAMVTAAVKMFNPIPSLHQNRNRKGCSNKKLLSLKIPSQDQTLLTAE